MPSSAQLLEQCGGFSGSGRLPGERERVCVPAEGVLVGKQEQAAPSLELRANFNENPLSSGKPVVPPTCRGLRAVSPKRPTSRFLVERGRLGHGRPDSRMEKARSRALPEHVGEPVHAVVEPRNSNSVGGAPTYHVCRGREVGNRGLGKGQAR